MDPQQLGAEMNKKIGEFKLLDIPQALRRKEVRFGIMQTFARKPFHLFISLFFAQAIFWGGFHKKIHTTLHEMDHKNNSHH